MTNPTSETPIQNGVSKQEQGTANKALFLAIVAMAIVLPESAYAAAQPWDNVVATLTGIFTGGLARAIAILVIIGLGISAMVGKLSWKLAGGLIGGIVLIFGATAIADFFIAGV